MSLKQLRTRSIQEQSKYAAVLAQRLPDPEAVSANLTALSGFFFLPNHQGHGGSKVGIKMKASMVKAALFSWMRIKLRIIKKKSNKTAWMELYLTQTC